jgi:hypothetical protein
MRKILEGAALRSKTVELFGETFVCLEPPGHMQLRFATMLKENKPDARVEAFTFLIHTFVTTASGALAFTEAEARTIAGGNAAVLLPLFAALTDFEPDEKKGSTPAPDSATDSPPPLEEVSKS